MQWSAGVDARDVEFVLGSPRGCRIVDDEVVQPMRWRDVKYLLPNTSTRAVASGEDLLLHNAQLYLIDFNRCKSMRRDLDGVAQAMNAFFANDPYYPRPEAGGVAVGVLREALFADE